MSGDDVGGATGDLDSDFLGKGRAIEEVDFMLRESVPYLLWPSAIPSTARFSSAPTRALLPEKPAALLDRILRC